ncbi:uncharacterized protein IL334_005775 [Kwoniella shivajii]|uniref:Uncharacterized protein n=1 Tax=Kwoniella shivajii TaxID=564305 RepID=A0ABZ1D5Y3_9TREE|nr:hypothetical protein IL334_005775 [Kwoniella shivajii]
MSIVLVTGGNKGIGYEAVKYVSQRSPDDSILLASRSVLNGEDAVNKMKTAVPGCSFANVEVVQLDITDRSSIDNLVNHVRSKYGRLDILVHNSGISNAAGDPLSPEVFVVNIQGAHDTIEAFLPLLPKNTGKIALVSSEVGAWYMHNLDESSRKALDEVDEIDWPQIEEWMTDYTAFSKGQPAVMKWIPLDTRLGFAYTASKALVTTWGRSFAVHNPQVKLAIVCPGYCATDLNHFSGTRPAAEGGKSIVWPLYNEFESGHFYQDGVELPFAMPIPEGMMG